MHLIGGGPITSEQDRINLRLGTHLGRGGTHWTGEEWMRESLRPTLLSTACLRSTRRSVMARAARSCVRRLKNHRLARRLGSSPPPASPIRRASQASCEHLARAPIPADAGHPKPAYLKRIGRDESDVAYPNYSLVTPSKCSWSPSASAFVRWMVPWRCSGGP